jgi:formate/nitrite transporter FocA (FNT family)
MQAIRKDVDKRLTDLKAEMDDVEKKAAKAVKEEPLLVLGMAFLAGIAVGIALANLGD